MTDGPYVVIRSVFRCVAEKTLSLHITKAKQTAKHGAQVPVLPQDAGVPLHLGRNAEKLKNHKHTETTEIVVSSLPLSSQKARNITNTQFFA